MIPEASATPTLCVSIVLHESCLDQLETTLASLLAGLREAREGHALSRAEVVVFDNASPRDYLNGLAPLLQRQRTRYDTAGLELRYVAGTSNSGFGGGHNNAAADVDSTYLLILNPDVELAPNAVSLGLTFLDEYKLAVALNPASRRSDGSPEYLCKRYPTVFDLLLRGAAPRWLRDRFRKRLARYCYADLQSAGVAAGPQRVELLSGACLLCRREAFAGVGGFDESFFMYFEDFDLSLRLATLGQLYLLPTMKIVHHGGFAARKGLRHVSWFARSAQRFFRLHGWRFF